MTNPTAENDTVTTQPVEEGGATPAPVQRESDPPSDPEHSVNTT